MPVHMLSVLHPPKNIPEHLRKIFVRFFWSTKEEGRSRHWASWQNLCLPKEEWGLGFRSLYDMSRALFAKLWWRFRTTKSLWPNFMWNKYCKKEIPMVVQFRKGSHVWRQMLNAREEVEHEFLWELKSGTTNIWHENWAGLGALYHVLPKYFPINEELERIWQNYGKVEHGMISC
ncbi:putative mitochondrial protein AtMg00310 [Nicotiana tabacum]|uniref:Mitochondrial protein AtMg00310 n=1 Tax=Nicotiana tabacum TaxID=4097 RepID=A0AC58RVE0_TOBAC